MISLNRKVLGVKMENIYFPVDCAILNPQVDLIGVTQSLSSYAGLTQHETMQINLLQPREVLFAALTKSTRKQVRHGEQRYSLTIEYIESPTDDEIREFRRFYNQFAKNKKTYKCNFFHEYTLRLLRNSENLLITRILDEDSQILCYRVYIKDRKVASSLYSASHYRFGEVAERKRLLSVAHRTLKWRNIMYFKDRDFETYDSGGLTGDENIRNFKLEFGGEIVNVYSGYFAKSFYGRLILFLRNMKINH